VWQWIRHAARLDDGRRVDAGLVQCILREELESIRAERTASPDDGSESEADRLDLAASLMEELTTADGMADFLTLPAYPHILTLA
jgi:malate synthase